MARLFIAVFGLACSSILLGCGLRGPLYLPDDKTRTGTEAAQPAAPGDPGKVVSPQPAPQAQKRDRATGTDPLPAPPAN